ncbi:MAG: citrate lyase ACP [Candidatus Marinimicrobia bacterium]|nr:citrate lyase ACP [Candidatus Neomarinimicrobiota bacterium]
MTHIVKVGPKPNSVRSDLRVSYSPGRQPLAIEIQSKVGALYGKSIKEQTESVCKGLGVDTGKLVIEDFGAVPFVIAARIEAALKMANPKLTAESLPPMKDFCKEASMRDRFRRSRLYIPGNQPKLMLNAGIHKPDGIILDLEDSVPPSEKNATRYVVRNALRSVNFFGAERMVRINQGEMGIKDLEFLLPHNVHVILIPKVESADQIKAVDKRIAEICMECGREDPVYLMPIIESARGVLKALEIAEASQNNVALTIGLEDYTADIGTERTDEGSETFFARNIILNAARAAGIQAINSVFSDVADEEGLRLFVRNSKSLGFDGVGCIHPRQIRVIHQELAPTQDEIEKAKKIVLAYREAQKKGLGVVALGSKMIDPPVVKRAQQTVELAIATDLLVKNWRDKGK